MNTTSCSTCSGRYTMFSRRKLCTSCKNHFCNDCLTREGRAKWCRPCYVLIRTPNDKVALGKLSVKELRSFLTRKHISLVGCSEKKDLVDLVYDNFGAPANEYNRAASSDRSVPSRSGQSSTRGGRSRSSPRMAASSSMPSQRFDENSSYSSDDGIPAPQPASSAAFDDGIRVRASDGDAQERVTVEDVIDDDEMQGEDQRRGSSASSSSSAAPEDMHQDSPQAPAQEQAPVPPVDPQGSSGGGRLGRFPSVSDLATLDDVDSLSVRECKELLALYRVDFKGACEKEDLLAKVRALWIERQQAKHEAANLPDDDLCRICMDGKIDCVLLDCGHMVTCTLCGKKMNECPICRQYVVRAVHVFRA